MWLHSDIFFFTQVVPNPPSVWIALISSCCYSNIASKEWQILCENFPLGRGGYLAMNKFIKQNFGKGVTFKCFIS